MISSLITFESKENLIFMLNNLYFQTFILIIKKCDKVFAIIMITKYNEIINIEINQVQRFFLKANVNFIKCLTCFFDNA